MDTLPRPLLRRSTAFAAAIVGGLLLGLSQPFVAEPFGTEPIDQTGWTGLLALIGYVPALVGMKHAGPKRAYWIGFFALWVQFSIIVYWVTVAMTVFGGIPWLVALPVLLLLTSAMAGAVAAAFAVTRMIVGRFFVPQWIVFPAALTAIELLRNFGPLGGFPWGNVGYSTATVPVLRQAAALFGVYGLVFVIGLVNAGLAEVVAWRLTRDVFPRRAVAVTAAVLGAVLVYGVVRLQTPLPAGPTVKVGLLQGNIEQGIKNKSEQNANVIFDKFHDLQDEALQQGAQLVVWPEAAFPIRVQLERQGFENIGLMREGAPPPPASIVGVSGVGKVKDEDTGKIVRRHSNSAFYLQGTKVIGRVDKTHLVPFGEYVPWPLQDLIKQIVPIGSAIPGKEWVPIAMRLGDRDVKVGTTICYEGIFPEISREFARAGVELMVNITNDAWYGVSSAAMQHLLMYSLRAVESGRSVARAANTGISAWVDVRGEVHAATSIYTGQALVVDVPIGTETTLYMLLGEWVALPCLLMILGAWMLAMVGTDALRRRRHVVENITGVLGLLIAVSFIVWYFASSARGDEAKATHTLLAAIGGLLVGTGALSSRPWGRKAQLWVFGLTAVLSLLGLFVGAWTSLLFSAVGAALFVVAARRKDRYTRPADPLVLQGR